VLPLLMDASIAMMDCVEDGMGYLCVQTADYALAEAGLSIFSLLSLGISDLRSHRIAGHFIWRSFWRQNKKRTGLPFYLFIMFYH
jgi:hypothetical protein